ncbi:oligosaccharide flippase family protein [Vibrio fluvialis]|nr:oligosaccharide flippase family protein [Vibrio fluvialis]
MNDLFKNIKTLAIGSGSAKLIGIIATPILTRLYTPDEFGMLSLFNAITLIVVPFMTLRYVVAITLPRTDKAALHVFSLCLSIISVLFILIFGVVHVLKIMEIEYFLLLGNYIYLIPIASAFIALYETISYWLTRRGSFKILARCSFIQGLSGALAKIVLSFLNIPALGLIIGQIMQQSNGILLGIRESKELRINYLKSIRVNKVLLIASYYSDFPKYRLFSQILLIIAIQMPVLAFAHMYTPEIVGQLSLATMLITIPVNLFGNSTGKAYYSKICSIGRYKPEEIYDLTVSLIKKLFLFSIPVALGIFLLSPYVFPIAFGSSWGMSGQLASIMSFILIPQFISAPVMNALNLFNKQRLAMTLNIFRLSFLLAVFYTCFYFKLEPIVTMKIYVLFSSIYYCYVMYVIVRVIRNEKISQKNNSTTI